MSKEVIDNTLLPKLIKIYFSKNSTIDFTKIKQKAKGINENLKKYSNLTVPSWVEGSAKDLAVDTLNFIKNNKHLLSPSKNLFIYQEYQQLLQFKLALDNLSILFKEDKKVQSMSLRNNKRINYRNSLSFLSIIILIFIILLSQSSYSNTVIYISLFLMVTSMVYLLITNLEFRRFFFSPKGADAEKEELEHQIDISNKKITKSILYFN